MATSTWITDATGEWNVAADWSGGVPDAGTDAIIAQGNPKADATTGAIAAHSLTLSAPGALTFDDGVGDIGTALTNNGTLSLSNGSSLTTATLTNAIGGSLALSSGSSLTADTLTNAIGGSLALSTGSSLASGTLTNSGTINDSQGTLNVAGAITGTGSIDVAVATTVEFHGAVASTQTVTLGDTDPDTTDNAKIVVDDAADFHGTVANFITSDVIHLAGQTVTGLSLSGSTLTATLQGGGTSTFAVSGTFTGIMAQSDGYGGSDLTPVTLTDSGGISVSGSGYDGPGGRLAVAGALTNSGEISISASSFYGHFGSGSSLDITGTLINSGGIGLSDDSSLTVGTLINSGIIGPGRYGGGSLDVAGALTNSGTIRDSHGTLDIGGAVTGLGTIDVGVATTMEFHGAVASTQMVALGDNNARTPDLPRSWSTTRPIFTARWTTSSGTTRSTSPTRSSPGSASAARR
jgi:filamentous hemagglutinin